MGTRHLVCVTLDGEFKVAQYGQWDGYPEGQGVGVLAFAREIATTPSALEAFKAKVRALRVADKSELDMSWRQRPEFSRDTGSKILQLVASGAAPSVFLQPEFGADSLFCEWAYNLDLDANAMEVFKGFQKSAHTEGRFSVMKPDRDNGYFPVRLVATFKLDSLPSAEDFVAAFREKEEATS